MVISTVNFELKEMASRPLPTLTLEAAKIASDAAQEKAKEMGIGKSFQVYTCFLSSSILHISKEMNIFS